MQLGLGKGKSDKRNPALKIWGNVTRFIERFSIIVIVVAIVILWLLQAFVTLMPFEKVVGVFFALVVMALWVVARRMREPELKLKWRFDPDQDKANAEIVNFIKSEGPQAPADHQVARLIEYSSYTVEPIIRELVLQGWKINLLLFDPLSRKLISEFQKNQRICFMIKRHKMDILAGYERAEIRFYEEQPSIRGRKLGNKLIQTGYYTYEQRPEAIEGMGVNQIWGHDNPLMTASLASDEGRMLEVMFDRVWKDFWDSGRSKTIRDVCGNCNTPGIDACLGGGADEWFKVVSSHEEEKKE